MWLINSAFNGQQKFTGRQTPKKCSPGPLAFLLCKAFPNAPPMRLLFSLLFGVAFALNVTAQVDRVREGGRERDADESDAAQGPRLGNLAGVVVDKETGETIAGAQVFVVGTLNKGAITDADGAFEITDIKAGDYTIRINNFNYAELNMTAIAVVAGQTVTIKPRLTPSISTTETVIIEGEANLLDLDNGTTSYKLDQSQLRDMNVDNVQDVIALQPGVNITPDGLQIRGGRVYETEYYIDGVSAQDPLAGTGFGVDLGSSSIKSVELITGGAKPEFAGVSSGVIAAELQDGIPGRGDPNYEFRVRYHRDNIGINVNEGMSWNTDVINVSVGGPIVPIFKKRPPKPGGAEDVEKAAESRPIGEKLFFFASGQAAYDDTYFRVRADQLNSSLLPSGSDFREGFNNKFIAPRQNNNLSGTLKLTYLIKPSMKLSVSSQQSIAVNQNARTLQIVGNDAILQPGLQWFFAENPDNANTYTHRSNLTTLNFTMALGERWNMTLTGGRLFTNLRADANGRPFRQETLDAQLDAFSIHTTPITVFNPGDSSVLQVNAPSGFVNNDGIASLWHDHYASEYTAKAAFNWNPKSKVHYLSFGWEHKELEYQWIDVSSPWVGAPVVINDSTTFSSNRIGSSNDIWNAKPKRGAWFFSDEIRYKGLIAHVGFRVSYWSYGKTAEDAVYNPDAPVLDQVREDYLKETYGLFGQRWKARILPKLRVSFPVTTNNVLYFNYGHALRVPHPRFIYAGLDPAYQDNSFLSNLGNPNLDPETTVSYELGLKTQFNKNTALSIAAYYNDKFDYIVSRKVNVRDFTGRFVEKTFFINQDYARIRGVEVQFLKRIGSWFSGNISLSYQVASGKSNSARESALQIANNGEIELTKEQPLAWDRPLDVKLALLFKSDTLPRIKFFRNWRVFMTATYKSGFRYTPYEFVMPDPETGRPLYERQDDQNLAELGRFWFWTDLRITRDVYFNSQRSRFISLFVEFKNLFNNKITQIYNPVTGRGYEFGDPVPSDWRDPAYPSPTDNGTPPDNPARYRAPRQFIIGLTLQM